MFRIAHRRRSPVTPGGAVAYTAVSGHEGRRADLVRALKYGRATTVIAELADELAAVAPPSDVVTWIPASPSRRRRRGFDQGELLARSVARRLGRPARRLLRRADDVAQTSRDRAGREAGPTFVPAGRRLRGGCHVLVVDDVRTTGATLAAAAAVLRRRGAGSVEGLVVTDASGTEATADRAASTIGSNPPCGGTPWTSPSAPGMSTSRRDWRR